MADRRSIQMISDEFKKQQDKYGSVEYHPDGTGLYVDNNDYSTESKCAKIREAGDGTWKNLLLTELQEALCQCNEEELQAHLVKSAATTAAWIECLQRRINAKTGTL